MACGWAAPSYGSINSTKVFISQVPSRLSPCCVREALPKVAPFDVRPSQWVGTLSYTDENMVVIYGIHSVSEALKSGARSFEYVGIARERHDQRAQRLIDDCRASGVQVRFLPREQLDRTANTNTHQGVIAVTSSKQYADVDTLLDQRHGEHSFLVVLDSVEDPHNLGALIRTEI